MYELTSEISRRRTFAIISHPDAGKTTLTEKLLLYGGAIRQAGSVKGRKANAYATSDWMEIEKQRGISVTSSAMNFEYNGYRINILDTPGHQDFSEDAYRTLIAADSAVMLLDGAKGVEAQTIKLFHVCKMRKIPIFTFINKMDRFTKNPFDLQHELETTLGIRSYPVTWPVHLDGVFKGVYNRTLKTLELFEATTDHGNSIQQSVKISLEDPKLSDLIGEQAAQSLRDDITLLEGAGETFDIERVKSGELTPMFFGSAMTNFGVQQFLEDFIEMAPRPTTRKTSNQEINPYTPSFSGFIFKIQANMDPKHRDRIAFMRICSGMFEKGMSVYHSRLKKEIRLSQPQQFLAQDRDIIDVAFAGDIIGIFDSGSLHLGDTLYSSGFAPFEFEPIPMFPSEYFAVVSAKDMSKRKQFEKGMHQLREEGAVQIFQAPSYGADQYIIGVAGALQLEVLAYRLLGEYGVQLSMESLPFVCARWVTPEDTKLNLPTLFNQSLQVADHYGRKVVLFSNIWTCNKVTEDNPSLVFHPIAPDFTKLSK